jgi:hypothetical protein
MKSASGAFLTNVKNMGPKNLQKGISDVFSWMPTVYIPNKFHIIFYLI